ncbi:hypothetical protein [Leptospira sp. GIMC2001]|uniref:hypothetical protein n=1 Tax=Leptospira sp. GIMC2001 TaxID=1513297 RepID=UPI00234C00A2|nr:hypothetical protein [Leptospira sp. GIMC2001]WCL51519.1 hypothetical protein O4O04_20090 [Leptospira sp. GIMC2001]
MATAADKDKSNQPPPPTGEGNPPKDPDPINTGDGNNQADSNQAPETSTKKEEFKEKEKKKVSELDKFIANTPELAKRTMTVAFKIFCSKNFKPYNGFKTAEDCKKAFNKFYGREDKK